MSSRPRFAVFTRDPGRSIRGGSVLIVAVGLLAFAACQQKMANQPYFRAQEESSFFGDGRSARTQEPGTVSFGRAFDDDPLLTGLTAQGRKRPKIIETAAEPPLPGAANDPKNYVDVFPFELKAEDIRRGMERYTIFCTPCHSPLGDGKGKIVERGFTRPTAYYPLRDAKGQIEDGSGVARSFERFRVKGADGKPLLLKDVPVGYYFEVMTNGFGAMADYSAQIPPADRWRIAAYIRTLQLSQAATEKELSKADWKSAMDALKKHDRRTQEQ
jgi:cytochrome c1